MIEELPIKQLKLLEKNPRRISKEQFEKLCTSMKEDKDFIKCRPILINRVDGELIVYAGNQRVRAAKKIGWKAIHCIIEDNLDDDLMQKRCVLDNSHFGSWDFDILSTFDSELLLSSGFTEEILTGAFDIVDNSEEKSEEDSDKEPSEKKKKECPNCGHLI